jgi:hypothetical protein
MISESYVARFLIDDENTHGYRFTVEEYRAAGAPDRGGLSGSGRPG